MMTILKNPLVTEKMSSMNEKGRYGFIVDRFVSKIEIKKEVEKIYGVKVKRVNTMNVMGKLKVRHTKQGTLAGRRPSYKKAIVLLEEGQIIDFYADL